MPRRRMLNAAISLLGIYMALAVVVMLCQRRMIYHPTRYSLEALEKAAAGHGFAAWKDATSASIGWKRTSPTPPAEAQVLIIHGNAGCALDRVDYADALQAVAPVDVFLLEYPGYGARAGSPSQTRLLEAATQAFELLAQGGPVYLVGESLGTGVVAHLAGKFPDRVAGVMLFCPYNSLTAVAQQHMPLFPVKWMLWDRFPSDQWLASYPGPAGFLVASEDIVVPARFGRRLYEVYPGRKKLWEIAGADHNTVFQRPPGWWRELFEFWQERTKKEQK